MWNMQRCMAHLLVDCGVPYLPNSARGGAKTMFSDHNWLYFQSRLLRFKDIEHWRLPKDAPCKAAYFTYQALNFLFNIVGLSWANHLVKTRTEPAGSRCSLIYYITNHPKMEPLLILLRRHLLEYAMHLSNDYYRIRYSLYRLFRYAWAFNGQGNILSRTVFKDGQIQSALGDDASISWLRSIQQAI